MMKKIDINNSLLTTLICKEIRCDIDWAKFLADETSSIILKKTCIADCGNYQTSIYLPKNTLAELDGNCKNKKCLSEWKKESNNYSNLIEELSTMRGLPISTLRKTGKHSKCFILDGQHRMFGAYLRYLKCKEKFYIKEVTFESANADRYLENWKPA